MGPGIVRGVQCQSTFKNLNMEMRVAR
jgi:hypothetical protein